MKLDVYSIENTKVGEIEVSDEVFGAEVKPYLHHEVVRYQLAKKRAGTHSTKTRSEVSGSTRSRSRARSVAALSARRSRRR